MRHALKTLLIEKRRHRGQPPHPGYWLTLATVPYEISQNALARALGVPPRLINQLIHGERAITPRTAILLGDFFANGPMFWMKAQAEYDIDRLRRAGVQLDPNRRRVRSLDVEEY